MTRQRWWRRCARFGARGGHDRGRATAVDQIITLVDAWLRKNGGDAWAHPFRPLSPRRLTVGVHRHQAM
jgi:hypothetical protein